jgi:hypothetical protein
LLLVMGLNLLIPPGKGPIIMADNLPLWPSMEHGEVFEGFFTSKHYKKTFSWSFLVLQNLEFFLKIPLMAMEVLTDVPHN